MRTIYKYKLSLETQQLIKIPLSDDNRFFSVGYDRHKKLCLWCGVDTDKKPDTVLVSIYGTGRETPDDPGQFVGTVIDRPLVWHVFVDTLAGGWPEAPL